MRPGNAQTLFSGISLGAPLFDRRGRFRVHPDPAYRETLAVIELKEDREFYLLPRHIARELPGEFVMAQLFTAINRQGVLFLWPVRLPGTDGRTNRWHTSAAEAATHAMSRWIRVKANMALGV